MEIIDLYDKFRSVVSIRSSGQVNSIYNTRTTIITIIIITYTYYYIYTTIILD